MNVILKAFDSKYCKETISRAFRGMKIGTCISILNDRKEWPNIDCEEHMFLSAADQRTACYDSIDWNDITPIDEALIEHMRPCEATFLTMIERYARYGDIPYAERERQYFAHLRFWNHIIETKKIDLLLMNTEPHQCYDWVLYHLCKIKGIPIRYIERCFIVDGFYLVSDLEQSAVEIGDHLKELRKEYEDPTKEIPLSPKFEEYYRSFSQECADPWYMYRRPTRLNRKNFFAKWGGTAVHALTKKPLYVTRSIVSPAVWSRKLSQHKTTIMYDRHARSPDLSKPYIYFPLHLQPEGTTCPMGGAYTDQNLIADLLASILPLDISIYLKEHPAQEELCRSEEFYQSLLEITSLTFVPRDFSTFALIDHAIAVATVTGTVGFEAIFRGKPVLMFGHRFFQYAPGVQRVTTADDCRNAIARVRDGKGVPTLRDARLFLKTIEDTATPYAGGPPSSYDTRTKEEKALIMGEKIAEVLHTILPHAHRALF